MDAATPATPAAPSGATIMDPSLQAILLGNLGAMTQASSVQITNDLIMDQRGHSRYMHQLDRLVLGNFLAEENPLGQVVAGLNTASHAPSPQPWASPTRPAGT